MKVKSVSYEKKTKVTCFVTVRVIRSLDRVTTNVHDTPLKLCEEARASPSNSQASILGLPIPDHGEVLPYSESVNRS